MNVLTRKKSYQTVCTGVKMVNKQVRKFSLEIIYYPNSTS